MKGKMISFVVRMLQKMSRLGESVYRAVKIFWWPSLCLLFVVIFWLYLSNDIPLPDNMAVEEYGVYGDSFGRVTSIFTALGFGGLIITLLLQQRQISAQAQDAKRNRQSDEQRRYEEVLFKLLDIYRQTLSEVRVGEVVARDVLKEALNRVDDAILEEGVNDLPRDIKGRWDSDSLTGSDRQRIDYLQFRNFKIVATEIHPQARLVDTLEVLLEHMHRGAPGHLLVDAYRELVFAQFTFLECRYFFLVALSHPGRHRLRDLLSKTGFFDRISRSQIHQLHRVMYEEYWGHALDKRELPANIPMSPERIKIALRAHKAAGGVPKTTYTPLRVRQSQGNVKPE